MNNKNAVSKSLTNHLLVGFFLLGAIQLTSAQSIYTPYLFTAVVGNPPGSSDGTGTAARFDGPFGLVVSPVDGAIYLADSNNNTIRKCSRPGAAVTTFAGMAGAGGSADGTASAARFLSPKALAFDRAGNLFVADSSNNTIRKIDPRGNVTTFAGLAGVPGSANGVGSAARFNFPTGIAIGPSGGNIFVADYGNNTIREIDSVTAKVSTLAGKAGKGGYFDSPSGSLARFNAPTDLTVDALGKVYVADTDNFVIRVVDSITGATITLAGTPQVAGSANGQGLAAQFNIPSAVVVNPTTLDVYVADTFNQSIRKIDAQRNVTTFAGLPALVGSADGQGSAARFDFPRGITGYGTYVYVADTNNNTIRQIDSAANVTTFAGSASSGNVDGPVATARLTLPNGIAFDSANNMYIAEPRSEVIRKVSAAGVVSTFAGTLNVAGSADGVGVQAQFYNPTGVAVDSHDNVYVTDRLNNTIRMITPDQMVTTIAGAPPPAPPGDANGPGVDARFSAPTGLAFDSSDNLYVTDTTNETIRLIAPDADHTVSLLAGQELIKGSANGQGTTAQFSGPSWNRGRPR